jgi:hypothetical protein
MSVMTCAELPPGSLERLLAEVGVTVCWIDDDAPIPGSYWGEPEAGLVGDRLLIRRDTPVHSALHEACHYVCMDADRRAALHADAGGSVAEENGVCYLQVLYADELPGVGRVRMFTDMDAWGYSFRLGGARAWFEADAEDAADWLRSHGLVDESGHPNRRVRE